MPQISAIGTSPVAAAGYGAPSAAGLQAQLQRFQKQLSECVNCASAKTPEGKANIQAISARISQIRERINQAEDASSGRAGPDTAPAIPVNSTVGNVINVFA